MNKKLLILSATVLAFIGSAAGVWFIQNSLSTSTSSFESEMDRKKSMQEARWKAEFDMIKNPATGKIPDGIRYTELNAAESVSSYYLKGVKSRTRALPTIPITSKGPNNYGGRTRAIAFDVRNSSIMIAGGVSGGIFRSTNGGAAWSRVTPAGQIHNLTAIAQDPRTGSQDIWYAATGEKIGNSADATGASYLGYGIFKSIDNGLTWTALSSTQGGALTNFDSDFDYVSRLIVDPTNGAVLAVTGEEINRSADGGATWTSVLGSDQNGNPGDIIYNTVGNKFYAAIHGSSTTANGGIHESSNGITWTQIRTGAQLNSNGVGRIVISNVANTDDIVAFFQIPNLASCTDPNTNATGLVHFDGTSTWTDHSSFVGDCVSGGPTPSILSTQGGYNMAITTKPNDPNLVYFGGVEIYRYNLSTNAYEFIGGSQSAANNINLHVDNHILIFDPNNSNIMWAGNDGGMRSTDVTGIIKTTSGADNGYTWTNRSNNYETYQYFGGDINPTTGSEFFAGAAQDNAFTIQPISALSQEVGPTADGTDVGIISGVSFLTYKIVVAWQNGGLARLDNGVETDIQPTGQAQGFHTSFFLDGDNTDHLYYPASNPSNGLYRTRIASTMASGNISGNAATGWEAMTGVSGAISSPISAMETTRGSGYSASDANRKMYFGTQAGKVFRLADPAFATAATAPVDISPSGMSGAYVSDIAVNPIDDKEIMVTYSNYGVTNIWHTTDASVASPTWTNIEGATTAVQEASIRSAMIVSTSVSNRVYMVGTSTGLYATDALNGGSTVWSRVGDNTNIGWAVCTDMRLRTSDNTIALATHGNGMFKLKLPTLSCNLNSTIETAPGLHTAVLTEKDGAFNCYCNAAGNMLLALDTTGSDAVIPTSGVRLEIGATPTTSYTTAGGIVHNPAGGVILNRKWDVVPTTQPGPGKTVKVKYSFTHPDYIALDAQAQILGTTITNFNTISLYKLNGSGLGDPHATGASGPILTRTTGAPSTSNFVFVPSTATQKAQPPYNDHTFEFLVSSFSGGSIGFGANNQPLPLDLLSFTAQASKVDVDLTWTTANEENVDGFGLEHSTDGINWEEISWLSSQGNSIAEQNYRYTHSNPSQGKNYYRLRQVDIDGAKKYSDVRVVIFSQEGKLSVWPNPAHDVLNIAGMSEKETAYIYNVLGTLVGTQTSDGKINIAHLAAGPYFIKVGKVSKMFIKK